MCADICMCNGAGCRKKKTCYRHTAPRGMRQSMFMASPINLETGKCEYYWNNKEYEPKRKRKTKRV